jgi:hypothetical protein
MLGPLLSVCLLYVAQFQFDTHQTPVVSILIWSLIRFPTYIMIFVLLLISINSGYDTWDFSGLEINWAPSGKVTCPWWQTSIASSIHFLHNIINCCQSTVCLVCVYYYKMFSYNVYYKCAQILQHCWYVHSVLYSIYPLRNIISPQCILKDTKSSRQGRCVCFH